MTEREAIEAIYEQFESGWEALHPASPTDPAYVPFCFRNEAFLTDALGALGAWARLVVNHTTGEQASMGSVGARKFERYGNVMVQLFAPVGSGVGTLADLAEDARTVLEGIRLGALALHAGRTQEAPDDGAWAMSVVVFEFRYTRTR